LFSFTTMYCNAQLLLSSFPLCEYTMLQSIHPRISNKTIIRKQFRSTKQTPRHIMWLSLLSYYCINWNFNGHYWPVQLLPKGYTTGTLIKMPHLLKGKIIDLSLHNRIIQFEAYRKTSNLKLFSLVLPGRPHALCNTQKFSRCMYSVRWCSWGSIVSDTRLDDQETRVQSLAEAKYFFL
jgi:hypothetical protein